ncbi:hypothetical protein DSECCO2_495640 [anaerobic digester metagenome]
MYNQVQNENTVASIHGVQTVVVCSLVIVCIAAPDIALIVAYFSIVYHFESRMHNQVQDKNAVASIFRVETVVISSCVVIRIAAPVVAFIVTYFSRLRKFKSRMHNQMQDENAVASIH